ncbi:oxidoreductase, short chain dehydrogenase/reductase family protein [Tritrichomonas foetus]|uniref:Oxidoreductase, short chain dehydrogenase/reductase family protein n=1 Tax=Tritrichomonas foetus TaxID=1144522 RepID=A0A1J4KQK7_9EUKA|nr:oxidoreductase, short chain dehydrogenase/reductase family protein [Tritrichomonas foetus]|eukprot:OHT13575.1 oxidoreductase, short chain dehydrogenase/reductase family protein [Tritrichomonas foetus]
MISSSSSFFSNKLGQIWSNQLMDFFETLFFWIGILCISHGLFVFYRWIISYIGTPINFKKEYQTEWALITGANSGLGNHLALSLADQGINIIGTGRNLESLETAKQNVEKKGVQFIPVQADFSDSKGVETVIQAIKDKDVGIAMLNAGFGIFGPVESLENEAIHNFVTSMCTSYTQLSKFFISKNSHRKEKSLLFLTASLAAQTYGPLATMYCSVKSYKSALAKHLSHEVRNTNIQVSAIHPGFFSKSRFFSQLPPFLGKMFTIENIYPTSEEVCQCVLKAAGKTTIIDCSANSLFIRTVCWISGEFMTNLTSKLLARAALQKTK